MKKSNRNLVSLAALIVSLSVGLFSSQTFSAIKIGTASFKDTSEDTSEFVAIPPFLERATGKPSVILAFDVSGSMLVPAYPETGVSWSTGTMSNFLTDKSYFGYFESNKQYKYDHGNGVFVDSALNKGDPGAWDGNFLNWLTMRRVDIARKVMIGGKVENRAGSTLLDGSTKYILEAEKEIRASDDYSKTYALSSTVSDIPNDQVITIADGKIMLDKAILSDKFETGYIDSGKWPIANKLDLSTWPKVTFLNTYVNPIVVVTAMTHNNARTSVVRAENITATGFSIGMQEWDKWTNAQHPSETLFYMVAEAGRHTIPVDVGTGTVNVNFVAGIVNTKENLLPTENENNAANYEYVSFPVGSFSSSKPTPIVFSGVSSLNDTTPDYVVSTRNYNIDSSGFRVTLQEQNQGNTTGTHRAIEAIHYIAIEPTLGTTSTGAKVEVGKIANVTQVEKTLTFNAPFTNKPSLNFSSQTLNGKYPVSVRVKNNWDNTTATVMLKRAQHTDSITTAERIGFMAVSTSGFNIKLAQDKLPSGLISDNDSNFNFGLSVYNFDHKINSLNGIVTGNKVHGGTMHPCYPIFDDTRRNRRHTEAVTDPYSEVVPWKLYDGSLRDYLCVPTSVHSPNDKIVQVIEEYPLIWGTTPIAESLVDIGRYVKQEAPQYQKSSSNSADNKTVGNDPRGVHGIDSSGTNTYNTTWDPFYDKEQGQKLPCKKAFVLHFNDGAPFTDYDGDASQHSYDSKDLISITGDSQGVNEALDNVALALRQNDCRKDVELPGHQEVISYFVYAALGSDEQENNSTRRMREAAAMGGFIDLADKDGNYNNTPDPIRPLNSSGAQIDFNAYYSLNSTPGLSNPTDCPENEWDTNSDCEPDTFYLALDGSEIGDKLQKALLSMEARIASGGAASVVSTTASGEGVLYQASFAPSLTINNDTVNWVGDVSGLLIDSDGYIRSDDGDAVLEDATIDPIYDSCYDEDKKTVRVKFSTDATLRPTTADALACKETVYTKILDDVGYLWSAKNTLADLTDAQALTQRASYGASTKNRYIRTYLKNDSDGNGSYSFEEVDFIPSEFTSDLVGMLNTSTTAEAETLINFIRGVDQAGMRSRQMDGKTLRLGDVIYSTPVPVGRPSETLHILYDDESYYEFYEKYRTRRTVVYVGGNDGMLHSFNGGWYNKHTNTFETDKTGYTKWDLGQELWSFVPYNLLPHLKYLSNVDYGTKDGDHMYFVDQTPYIFDAKIFGADGITGQTGATTHTNGWGTVMVVGFRTGGGVSEVYPDPTDLTKVETVRPSYLMFDITDPEQAPKLLAEFSHEKLGQTISVPTALTVNNTSGGIDWYLAIGSGPTADANGNAQASSDQNAHLFMLNLKTMSLESNFGSSGIMDLGETNSFVGDIVAVDYDLDVHTDALYFGTTKAIDAIGPDGIIDDWKGKLFRLRVDAGSSAGNHSWKTNKMIDLDEPILNRPQVSIDQNKNRWIHIGTGRFLTVEDTVDSSKGVLLGIKEPRQIDGSFDMDTFSNNSSVISLNSLIDVSDSKITEESGSLNNSISVSPALTADTIESLEQRQMQYSDSSLYTIGWKRTLKAGERAMGAGTIFGSFYTQTSYIPDMTPCSVIGESYLNALRYTTGTAWFNHVFPDADPNTDGTIVEDRSLIGKTPTQAPGIHLGESRNDGKAKFINLNSDMSLTITTESNLEGIVSKDTSWREL